MRERMGGWASDLIEQRSVSGGSKSQPGTATYSYSANLAVAFSSRPIARVGRIWADGNLLRGAAGDLKFETELRIHYGHQDQPVDPLLASSEAPGRSPAYRGLAYAVFERLQLAEFGNRIPSLTFEVFEREDAVPLHEILSTTSDRIISGETPETLNGFAIQGSDARTSIEPLINTFPVTLRPKGDGLEIEGWFDAPHLAAASPSAIRLNGKAIERPAKKRAAQSNAAASIVLRYYEKERDYQIGLQRHGPRLTHDRETQLELPACLPAVAAQRLTSLNWLQQIRTKSRSVRVSTFSSSPPMVGQFQTETREKITEIEYLNGCFRVMGQGWLDAESAPSVVADPGRDVSAPDVAAGQTLIQLVDLPAMAEPMPSQPVLGVVAAGTGEGWRKARLAVREGAALTELGRTAPPGSIGWLLSSLPAHSSHLVDSENRVMVRVHHPSMDFPAGSGDPLNPNAPIIHVAGELIKYGVSEQVGPLDFRLTKLVRGCFGSEGKIALHPADTALCILSPETMTQFNSIGLAFGDSVSIEAYGIGDTLPVAASLANVGLAIRPLPPCHLNVKFDSGQNMQISWMRRSRLDRGWRDYADLPIDEPQLAFDVQIESGPTLLATIQLQSENLEIPSATIGNWGLPSGASLTISVQQRGAYAVSAKASMSIILP